MTWYREWAIKAGFAIIDVNFPNHIANADVRPLDPWRSLFPWLAHAGEKDVDELMSDKAYEHAKRIAERNELAIYLWENYIE